MLLADHTTLVQFLIEERRRFPEASGELNAVILDVALACKAIARSVAHGALAKVPGAQPGEADAETTADRVAHAAREIFLHTSEWGGHLAGLLATDRATPLRVPPTFPKGKYLLLFDAIDRPSNLEMNGALGSLFSVLRAQRPGAEAQAADFLQPGAQQVCAGYAIYGPATMLVLTVGSGVHGFTLDPGLGEFVLTHPSIHLPQETGTLAIGSSNSRDWEPAVKRYVDECMAGRTGPRGKDFEMRWVASPVAELHRILMRGGVFLYPRDRHDAAAPGRLGLLCDANPAAFIIEQAGGRASTGLQRVLDLPPEALDQRVALMFGAANEIERLELYHRDYNEREYDAPLFGARGLFRATG
ncbi:MAG: fructose 1,6-bisphosphatase [Betaproteobacteria bacterium SG8_39]|nr:MAG: fructose 1,6-bisphosphatase [Betaproteobacteria bacterium SG8_39]